MPEINRAKTLHQGQFTRLIKMAIRKSVWAPGGADDGAHGL